SGAGVMRPTLAHRHHAFFFAAADLPFDLAADRLRDFSDGERFTGSRLLLLAAARLAGAFALCGFFSTDRFKASMKSMTVPPVGASSPPPTGTASPPSSLLLTSSRTA